MSYLEGTQTKHYGMSTTAAWHRQRRIERVGRSILFDGILPSENRSQESAYIHERKEMS